MTYDKEKLKVLSFLTIHTILDQQKSQDFFIKSSD